QEKLALECEISPSYLRLIEHGIANPTINELLKIAQVLSVNLQNPFPLPVLVDVV
ncbi:MAG: helix-turn-helix transcriptional regulator, partial [Clostridiales bacterium]|nr:helix-turn-helix transcriptional regulator [Clostridiales bacterium]